MNSDETRDMVQGSRALVSAASRLPASAAGIMALAQMDDAEFDARLVLLKKGQDRITAIFDRLMRRKTDYGIIPGTGDKPTLLQPGAEVINNFLGLVPTFESICEIGDGVATPVIRYRVCCKLHLGSEDGPVVGTGWGSCNSHEKRYRYRGAGRTCPGCGAIGTVMVSKFEPGGFYCNKKAGGCGASFDTDDARITSQQVGQAENPDPWDLDNTILKQGEKRALIGATKRTSGTSDLFTQDLDEMDEMIAAGLLGAGVSPGQDRPSQGSTGQGSRPRGQQGGRAPSGQPPTTNGHKPDAMPGEPGAIVAWFKARVAAMQPLSWPAETVAKNAQSLAMALKRSGFSDDARHRLYQTLTGKTNGGDLDPRELLVLLNSIQDAPQLLKMVEGTASGSGEAAPTSSPSTPNPPAPEPVTESESEPLGAAMPENLAVPLKAATRQYIWGAAPSPLSTEPRRRALGWKAARDRLKINRIDGAKADAIFAILHLVETGETLGPEEIGKRLNGHWLSAIQDCPESLIETLGEAADWWLSRRKGE